jgi:anti-sigma regulatory factor (Ser/Thr protein kinase)
MWSTTITASPRDIRLARRALTHALHEAGLDSAAPTVALLADELLSNVALHARSSCTITAKWNDNTIHVEVEDDHPGQPKRRRPDPHASSGRGLGIVEDVATRWGVLRQPSGGKVVWFEVPTVN